MARLTGFTKDVDGNLLPSCTCTLFKDNLNGTCTFVSQVTSDLGGAYLFQGIADTDPQYFVVAWKDGSPHVFDCTDHVLQPTSDSGALTSDGSSTVLTIGAFSATSPLSSDGLGDMQMVGATQAASASDFSSDGVGVAQLVGSASAGAGLTADGAGDVQTIGAASAGAAVSADGVGVDTAVGAASATGGLSSLGVGALTVVSPTASATWNPSDKSAGITLSGGNLTAHMANDADYVQNGVRGTVALSGKAYFRCVLDDLSGSDPLIGVGIAKIGANLSEGSSVFPTASSVVASGNNASAIVVMNDLMVDDAYVNDAIPTVTTTDIVDVAVDIPNLKLWVRKNGTGNWNNSGTDNPATNTGGTAFTSGTWHPFFGGLNGVGVTARFADDASGTAPSGFSWVG